jgi:hypothetical protein
MTPVAKKKVRTRASPSVAQASIFEPVDGRRGDFINLQNLGEPRETPCLQAGATRAITYAGLIAQAWRRARLGIARPVFKSVKGNPVEA